MQDSNMQEKEILKTCDIELVGLSVTMAARAVEKFFNRRLKKSGITMQQIYTMYAIAEYRGKSISYIASKLYMDRSTLSRGIDKIPDHVKIYKDHSDKRYGYPGLTESGVELLKKWFPRIINLEKGLGAIVSDKSDFIKFIQTFSSDIVKNKMSSSISDIEPNENEVKVNAPSANGFF